MNEQNLVSHLATKIAHATDALLREAITEAAGPGWTPHDVQTHGEIIRYPDGRQVFVWDGRRVLEMHPPMFDECRATTDITVRMTFRYRKL